MSTITPETNEVAALQNQLAELQAKLAAKEAPKPSKLAPAKNALKRVGKGLWAAVASTQAVKTEKSLVALIVTRLLLSAGAGTGLVELAKAVQRSTGW